MSERYGYRTRPRVGGVLTSILPDSRVGQPLRAAQRTVRATESTIPQNFFVYQQGPTLQGTISQSDSVWATAHGASTGTVSTSAWTASANLVATTYGIDRLALVFDTASLGQGTTILAAYLLFTGAAVVSGDSADLDAVDLTLADNTALATGDYDGFGTTDYGHVAISALSAGYGGGGSGGPSQGGSGSGAQYRFNLNDTFIAAVDPTGYTPIGLRISNDTDDSAPTDLNGFLYTESYDIGLVIKYV